MELNTCMICKGPSSSEKPCSCYDVDPGIFSATLLSKVDKLMKDNPKFKDVSLDLSDDAISGVMDSLSKMFGGSNGK